MHLKVVAAVAGCVSIVATTVAIAGTASAENEFTFGNGFAQASLVTPALNAGELSVPIILGEASAGYQDETGRAISTEAAIPLLAATGGGSQTCGVQGAATTVPLPDPLYADTSSKQNKGNVDETKGKDGGSGAVQEVHASPRASGRSRMELVDYDLLNLVSVSGAKAVASTVADPVAQTRTAAATTKIADISVAGGLIHLKGVRWDIEQHDNGADSRTSQSTLTKSFGIDGLTVGGVTIPIASPAGVDAAVKTANTLLEPLGLTIELPTFETNGQGRNVLNPLRIKIGGPNFLLTPVFGTALSNAQVVKFQRALLAFLIDPKDCNQVFGLFKLLPPVNSKYNSTGATVPLLTAAAVGVLSGGSTTLSIGGVATSLDDQYFPGITFDPPSLISPGGVDVPGTPGTPGIGGLPPGQSLSSTSTSSSKTGACHSTNPAGAARCWRGLAPLAAGLAGVVAVGFFAVDELSTRRRVARLTRNEIE